MKCKFIELVKGTKRPKTNFKILHNSCTSLKDAGLILNEDIVVVDFDKREDIALQIIQNYGVKSTKTQRGYHLYFKYPKNAKIDIKNASKVISVLGCEVDYKTGHNNSNAYLVIKQNGIERDKINFDSPLQELPKFLYPSKNKTNISEVNKGSRNQEILKHLTMVKKHYDNLNDFTILANTINLTLKEPLDKNEVEAIAKYVFENESKEVKPYYQIYKDVFQLWIDKKITSLAFKIYVLMYDRNKITQFYDENGRKYLIMAYSEIKKTFRVSRNPEINDALNQLEHYELIDTKKKIRNQQSII